MTTQEFSAEFDIQYDSIATNSAPGLDLYEKSVYLTRAQLQIVKNYFRPKGNKYQEGFEQSSKRRDDLKELVKSYYSDQKELNEIVSISKDSQFFKIPKETFLILQEHAYSLDPKLCGNNPNSWTSTEPLRKSVSLKLIKDKTPIDVKPITHDEYNEKRDNPFKKPDEEVIWRLDYGYSDIDSNLRTIELISPYDILIYKLRYVKYPDPIILTDLDTAFPNENLSIDGEINESTCKLKQNIHREILDRAVLLATGEYKPEMLQVRAQLNQTNE